MKEITITFLFVLNIICFFETDNRFIKGLNLSAAIILLIGLI